MTFVARTDEVIICLCCSSNESFWELIFDKLWEGNKRVRGGLEIGEHMFQQKWRVINSLLHLDRW